MRPSGDTFARVALGIEENPGEVARNRLGEECAGTDELVDRKQRSTAHHKAVKNNRGYMNAARFVVAQKHKSRTVSTEEN